MDFTCIVLFLALYHLKPQEWADIFSRIHFVQLVMLASMATLFFRERALKLKDFFRTPHDWAMYAFFGWVVLSDVDPIGTFKDFVNRLVFYVVIVQTLTNWERIRKFLGWWGAMLAVTAFLALGGEYFWDPLNSHDLTHGTMKGRLVLNLSMVNNPNALAHTLAPAISLLYYFFIWKRPFVMKEVGLFTLVLPLWAIYLTESKGGYFVSAAVIVATLTFGRPKILQVLIATTLVAGGMTALHTLPRMGELQKTKTDEAIQGRIMAFKYGYQYYDDYWRGVGQGDFIQRLWRDHKYYKASHSTYVQTGAETGRAGLFLFLLIMWCNFRTVLFAKTHTVEQERIRRILFVLVLSYAVSGWMVDFAYRPTFFMFTAAIAAFHRHLYKLVEESDAVEGADTQPYAPAWRTRLLPAPAGVPAELAVPTSAPAAVVPAPRAGVLLKPNPLRWQSGRAGPEAADPSEEEAAAPPTSFWRRIGIIDVIITLAWLKATEFLWIYAVQNI
jgi:hypothetical protein